MNIADLLTMEGDPGEPYRRPRGTGVQEALLEKNVDPARRQEAEKFLEAILQLNSGFNTPAVVKKKDTSNSIVKENRSDSIPSDTLVVAYPSDHSLPSIERSPSGYLITPITSNLITLVEEKAPDLGTRSDSSVLSSPPERILTPPGWSSPSPSGNKTIIDTPNNSGRSTPTMTRLENLAGFADANFSAFNALLDVASVAADKVNNLNGDMTMEKLVVAGTILQLDKQDRNSAAKKGYGSRDKLGMFTTSGKGKTVTPASPTKEDLLKKMEEQYRRSGMKPAIALGVLPITPSSTTKHENLWAPNHNAFQKTQPPEFALLTPSTARKPQNLGEDSDVTIADPNWSDGESDTEMIPVMAPAEKKKKPIQPQYSGPPAYLLDSRRTDLVAMAAKNNHPGSLNDLPSMLARTTPTFQGDSSQVSHSAPLSDPISTHSQFNGFDGSSDKKESLPTLREQDWFIEHGNILDHDNGQRELERLRAERKTRDDNEMYEGLKAFKGSQRGWSGEDESVRQETLKEYHQEGERNFSEAVEKERVAAAPKEKTPTVGKQPSQPDYSYMKPEKVLAVKAKQLEEGYSERYAKQVQASQDFDDYNSIIVAKNYQKMMNRPWDHHQIKRKALEEQGATVLEEQRAKLRKELWAKDMKEQRKAIEELRAESNKFEALTTNSTMAFGEDFALFPWKNHMKVGEQVAAKSKPSNPNLHQKETDSNPKEDATKPQENDLKRKERDAGDQNYMDEESKGMDEVKDGRIKKARKMSSQEAQREARRRGQPKRQYVFQTGRYKISKETKGEDFKE